MDQIKANPIQKENIKESDANTDQQQVIQQQQREQQQKQQQNNSQKQTQQDSRTVRPDYIFCGDNSNMEKLLKTYPHLKSMKEAEQKDFSEVKEAKCFIIRSNNEMDIHKAIKYKVWCSTPPNNELLNKTFQEAQEKDIPIYLYFSVVKSGQFVGIAELKSGLLEKDFAFWWQHKKWKGLFNIEWLFIKDISYKYFENLKNKEDHLVNRSKDGTELDWETTGLPMMKIYQENKTTKSIFNNFQMMDAKEQQYQRYQALGNPSQYQQMQELQMQMQMFQQQYQNMAAQQVQMMKNGGQNMNPQDTNQLFQQMMMFQQMLPQQRYNKPYGQQYNRNGGYNNNRRNNNNYKKFGNNNYQNKKNNKKFQPQEYVSNNLLDQQQQNTQQQNQQQNEEQKQE